MPARSPLCSGGSSAAAPGSGAAHLQTSLQVAVLCGRRSPSSSDSVRSVGSSVHDVASPWPSITLLTFGINYGKEEWNRRRFVGVGRGGAGWGSTRAAAGARGAPLPTKARGAGVRNGVCGDVWGNVWGNVWGKECDVALRS
eukprot:gene12079-20437_t